MSIQYKAKAQLNAADSLWFSQIFEEGRYADDSAFPGNWYIHDSVQSVAELFTRLDSGFKFQMSDFYHIDSMIVNDTLFYDSSRNSTYNAYAFAFQQKNPLVYVDFALNGKAGQAYAYYYPRDTSGMADFAFLLLPGNGVNGSTEIVQGSGYYNLLCSVKNELKLTGDVYSLMKPNEDARAIYHNKSKLNHSFMVAYLDSVNRRYGINYLAEIIATIQLLKKKYCKVMVFGLSEGGYSGLLASMITHPDGAMISAGYAVGFDTSWNSFYYLHQKFDSLVFKYDKTTVRDNIISNKTKYMFTWGDGDMVNLMQAEHDSAYTQQFLNDTTNCSFYYDYAWHTFPQCSVIDTFVNRVLSKPEIRFFEPYPGGPDSLISIVSNCSVAPYGFDLFRNDTLYHSYSNVNPDTLIALIDSGKYYLSNIVNVYGDSAICTDTIVFNKITPVQPSQLVVIDGKSAFSFRNPVKDVLTIRCTDRGIQRQYEVWDLYGKRNAVRVSDESQVDIPLSHLSPGIYILKVGDGRRSESVRLSKL